MKRVPFGRRVQIINCLVERNSIRSTERMTGTHRDTMRFASSGECAESIGDIEDSKDEQSP